MKLSLGRSLGISLTLCLCLNLWAPNVAALGLGDTAPSFALPRLLQGNTGQLTLPAPIVDLEAFSGAVIYLFFWDTFCTPCRDALPALVSMRNRYSRNDLEIIAINTDPNPRVALPLLNTLLGELLVVSDAAATVAAQYKVQELPLGLVLDRKGRLQGTHLGYAKDGWIRIEQGLRAQMFRTGEE